MCFLWSHNKWTALSTDVNALRSDSDHDFICVLGHIWRTAYSADVLWPAKVSLWTELILCPYTDLFVTITKIPHTDHDIMCWTKRFVCRDQLSVGASFKQVFVTKNQILGCQISKNWFEIRHWLRTSPWTALVEAWDTCWQWYLPAGQMFEGWTDSGSKGEICPGKGPAARGRKQKKESKRWTRFKICTCLQTRCQKFKSV